MRMIRFSSITGVFRAVAVYVGAVARRRILRVAPVAALVVAVTLVVDPTLATAAAGWLTGLASPAAAPPSSRVAAVRQGDVWVVDTASGTETRLTTGGNGHLLQWTDDGGALFFTAGPSRLPARTLRWRPGQGATPVPSGVWSPTGTATALTGAAAALSSSTGVWIESNGRRTRITPLDSGVRWFPLAWSSDGRRLALGRIGVPSSQRPGQPIPPTGGSLWVTEGDVLAGRLRQLPLPPTDNGQPGWPDVAVWSPDGRFLTVGVGPDQPCASCRADGVPYEAVPVDGGSPVPLGSALQPDEALSWSPAGSFVVLSTLLGQGALGRETYAGKQLVRVDLPSGNRRDLSHETDWADVEPAVSPDGTTIAFARGRAQQPWTSATAPGSGNTPVELIASRHVWLMDADGAQPRQLVESPGWTDEAPAWTPDGRWIVFVRWRARPTATAELWAVRSDGTGLQRVASGLDRSSYGQGFGYYGAFGWRRLFAIAPR